MKCNVGGWDRFLRIIVGMVILAIGYAYNSYWGLIGLLPVLTGLTRWCPAYLPFKFSTCKGGSCDSGPSCCCGSKK
jgi:hypothetical protein